MWTNMGTAIEDVQTRKLILKRTCFMIWGTVKAVWSKRFMVRFRFNIYNLYYSARRWEMSPWLQLVIRVNFVVMSLWNELRLFFSSLLYDICVDVPGCDLNFYCAIFTHVVERLETLWKWCLVPGAVFKLLYFLFLLFFLANKLFPQALTANFVLFLTCYLNIILSLTFLILQYFEWRQ